MKRNAFPLGVTLAWAATLIFVLLALGLSEVRHARQQLAMDIAQLNHNAGNLLLKPLLLDPEQPSRLAVLAQAVHQLDRRVDQDVRLFGLQTQGQRLKLLRDAFAVFEHEQDAIVSLALLLGSMANVPTREMQVYRLTQNLRASSASANDLLRLRAFLVARTPNPGPGAAKDPFLVGVENAATQVRAAIETIDRFESQRTQALSTMDEIRLSSLRDVEAFPVSLQRNFSIAAGLGGLLLLGFFGLRQTATQSREKPDQSELLTQREAAQPVTKPTPMEPGVVALSPKPPAVSKSEERVKPPSGGSAEPTPEWPEANGLAPASDMSRRFASLCRELQAAVDAAVQSTAGFDQQVQSLLEGAMSPANEGTAQMVLALQQIDHLLLHAREGAINMALGLDESMAGEIRFSAAARMEQNLSAAMTHLNQVQACIAGGSGLGSDGPATLVSRQTLSELRYELQQQLAGQQRELGNLSARLQQVQEAQPLSP